MELEKLKKIIDKEKILEIKKDYIQKTNKLDSRISYSVPLYSNEINEKEKEKSSYRKYNDNFQMKYENNEEIMKKRSEELEKVKKISSQVASITNDMQMKINEQGIMLDDIENNITNFQDNTQKAHKEITKTEFKSKKKKKNLFKLWCFILILFLIIIFYIYIIFH